MELEQKGPVVEEFVLSEIRSSVKIGVRASFISMVSSVLLAAAKLITGIIGHSAAMISDAANSVSDIITYAVVMGGLAASEKKADRDHQYGHEKIESIVAVLLALAIFATGVGIGYNGVRLIVQGGPAQKPSWLPAIAAAASMIVKLVLYRYVAKTSKKTGLSSLKALAGDHLSDVFASSGALLGIVGAKLGSPILDPIAAVIIALLIAKSAIEIFRNSADILLDGSVDDETSAMLQSSILSVGEVKRIDLLRTRRTGSRYYVEVEICCCRYLSLEHSHAIAQQVHDIIEQRFERVRHIMVHTNPCSGHDDFCTRCTLHNSH